MFMENLENFVQLFVKLNSLIIKKIKNFVKKFSPEFIRYKMRLENYTKPRDFLKVIYCFQEFSPEFASGAPPRAAD